MRTILFLLFVILGAGAAYGQFPANPNKIRLGNQTTGDGLVFRTAGSPAYTPSTINNAWIAFDTVAGVLYYYEGGTWNSFTSGGAGIDSIAYASDTLYIYTPAETFKAEIISGSSTPDSLSYTATTQQLSIIGSNTVSLLMNIDGTLLGSNTDAQKLRVDTAGTIASKVFLAGQLAAKLNISDTAAMLTPYAQLSEIDSTRIVSDSIAVYYQGGVEIGRDTIRVPGSTGGSGTVTSISQGVGIVATPNPITTTGTIAADTSGTLVSKTFLTNALSTRITGSGTTNTISKFTGATAIGNSLITDDGTNVAVGGTSAFRLPNGTTAQRPGSPAAGQIRYNTSNGNIDFYGAAAWENPLRSANANGLGTNTYIFYADGNGRATNSINFRFTGARVIAGGTDIGNVNNGYVAFNNSNDGISGFQAGSSSTKNITFGYVANSTPANEYAFIESFGGTSNLGIQRQPAGNVGIGLPAGGEVYNNPDRLRIKGINSTNANAALSAYNSSNNALLYVRNDGVVGIGNAAPARTLHVTGEARITDLTTDTPTRIVGADADGDLGAITVGSGLSLSAGTLTATGGVSDGDKGDIDVTSSGAVWTVDTNAITTVKISDGSVTQDKLASHSAGGAKLGGLTYISADDTDVNLSSYLSVDWLTNYSQLVVWLRIGNTASRTVTFPTPSSTYQGKVVEIFFGATNGGTHFGQITSGGTNRITVREVGTNVTTYTTYDAGQTATYMKVICAQDPNTLAYQWLVMDVTN